MTDNNTDNAKAFVLGMQTMRVLGAILDGIRTRHNLVAKGIAEGQIEDTDYNNGYLEGLLHVGIELEQTIKEMLGNVGEEPKTDVEEGRGSEDQSGQTGE